MSDHPLQSRITLQRLELPVLLGWPDAERAVAQTIAVDVTLQFSVLPEGCLTDALNDTHCYAALVSQISETVAAKPYHLLEHLGHAVYQTVKRVVTSASVRIDIRKYPPIPNLAGGVTFTIGD